MLLFFVIALSCEKNNTPDKKDDTIKIENLQTRLRIVVESDGANLSDDVEYVWRANPENILMHYPPIHSYKGNTYFG